MTGNHACPPNILRIDKEHLMNTHPDNNIPPNPPPAWPDDSAPQDADVPSSFDEYGGDTLVQPSPPAPPPSQTSIEKNSKEKGGRVSLFPSHNASIPGVEVWLADLHAWQCGGPMPPEAAASPRFRTTPRDIAEHIAAAMSAAKDKAAVTAVKSGLPGWTPAGFCTQHRASADVTAATGYVQLDFDQVGDEAEELLHELFAMPFCVQASISTSGRGVFAIVQLGIVPTTKDEYKKHLAALVAIVQEALGASWTDLFDPAAKAEGRPHYDPQPSADWSWFRYLTDGRGGRLLFRADAERAPTDVWLQAQEQP